MSERSERSPRASPAFRVDAATAYVRPQTGVTARIDLKLDANESPALPEALLGGITLSREAAARYPDARGLESELAERIGIGLDQVVVTAGADDALNRIALAMIESGRNAVLTTPTFEMIPRYVRHAGGEVREIGWMSGEFPVRELVGAANEKTAVAFVVSPNNPTGEVVTPHELRQIRMGLPAGCVLAVDAAYEEFADLPLTSTAMSLPATVVTRTFSKALGVAGLRVGYAVGDPMVISWLRTVGQPYAVSGVSLELVRRWLGPLEPHSACVIDRVRGERAELAGLLGELGVEALPSQANFVLANFASAGVAAGVAASLARGGIAVREFPTRALLRECLRITCPASAADFTRLSAALRAAIQGVDC